MWKNKIIKEGFNYIDSAAKEMTDFFETRVEILEPKEAKKKSFTAVKESKDKKSIRKQKQADSNTSVVGSSEEFSVKHQPN